MNALILAQHHGAFLTLESCAGKYERIIVAVPKSQIEKYEGFPEQEFKDFHKNMKAVCKKHKAELYVVQAPVDNHIAVYTRMIRELGGKGKWAFIAAGSLHNQDFEEPKLYGQWYAGCVGRPYDHDQRLAMYGMIGAEPTSDAVHLANCFINVDVMPASVDRDAQMIYEARASGKERRLSPLAIGRPDILIGQAMSSVECLRMRYRTMSSALLSYWMAVINRKHDESEFAAYPFDAYAPFAKKARKYLPPQTYDVIMENAAQSAFYRSVAELDL